MILTFREQTYEKANTPYVARHSLFSFFVKYTLPWRRQHMFTTSDASLGFSAFFHCPDAMKLLRCHASVINIVTRPRCYKTFHAQLN